MFLFFYLFSLQGISNATQNHQRISTTEGQEDEEEEEGDFEDAERHGGGEATNAKKIKRQKQQQLPQNLNQQQQQQRLRPQPGQQHRLLRDNFKGETTFFSFPLPPFIYDAFIVCTFFSSSSAGEEPVVKKPPFPPGRCLYVLQFM